MNAAASATGRGGVIAVVAHPDDESLIAGGTLALAARAGTPTGIVSLTRGEEGPISDPALADRAQLGDVRRAELAAAGVALGVAWTCCLTHPDGELPWIDRDAAARELAAILGPHAPAIVLTFGADGLYGHPDHVATREIVIAALALLPEPVERHEAAWPPALMPALVAAARERALPTDLWGLEPEAFGSEQTATLEIDIAAVLPRKLAALRAHRTQLGPDHAVTALPDDLAARFLSVEGWAGPRDSRLTALLAHA